MYTCDFVPSICKGESPKFIGSIKLKPLSYEERLDIIEEQAIIQGEAGDDDGKKALALLKFARMFSREKLKDYFISSSLLRVEDGYAFDSLEKIKMDGPASSVIPEISTALISGELSLGK